MNNEPVAIRYDFDGYGYQYMDSGSGSDWQTRVKGELLYADPACKHGVDDGACKECYQEATHPAKEDEGKVCARCGAIAYDPVIPQTVKELTYEDGIEECAQRAEAYAYMSPNFTALAEELRAILRKAQEK